MKLLFSSSFLIVFIVSCSAPDKHVEYYPGNKIKFEVPLVDGERHGNCVEYYRSGKVETKSKYDRDVLIDTSDFFAESGELIQRSIKNKMGFPVNVLRYKKDGSRDHSYMHPLMYLSTDSARTDQLKAGVPSSLVVNIGNVDGELFEEGTMIIGSQFDKLIARDTLYKQEGDPTKGFEYPFTPTGVGTKIINGLVILYHNEAGLEPKLFSFEFKYSVVE
jgi:antitoxin component YwqK of YwqJK toxin-antitoxin module